MSESKEHPHLSSEISDLASFVKSFWGLLAATSLFFPFLNQLTQSIPYPDDLSKGPSLALAAFGSWFLFLLTYRSRDLLAAIDDPRRKLPSNYRYKRIPLRAHRTTILASIVFLCFIGFLADYLNRIWNTGFGTLAYETSFVFGVMEYALIFMLATVSFSSLATAEYMRKVSEIRSNPDDRWPILEDALNAIYLRLTPEARVDFKGFHVLSEKRLRDDGFPVLDVFARHYQGLDTHSQFMIRVDSRGNVRDFRRLQDTY
jgi:hypothetical protein